MDWPYELGECANRPIRAQLDYSRQSIRNFVFHFVAIVLLFNQWVARGAHSHGQSSFWPKIKKKVKSTLGEFHPSNHNVSVCVHLFSRFRGECIPTRIVSSNYVPEFPSRYLKQNFFGGFLFHIIHIIHIIPDFIDCGLGRFLFFFFALIKNGGAFRAVCGNSSFPGPN